MFDSSMAHVCPSLDRSEGSCLIMQLKNPELRAGLGRNRVRYTASRFSLPVLSPRLFTFTPSVASIVR
jgi:hypothetical protein